MIDGWASDSETDEMVALFQDEIARLEHELRLRDEALAETALRRRSGRSRDRARPRGRARRA